MTEQTRETLLEYISHPSFIEMLRDIGEEEAEKHTRDMRIALVNNQIHAATIAAGKAEAWNSLYAVFHTHMENLRPARSR